MLLIKGAVDLMEVFRITETRVVRLDLKGKARVIREHHCNGGFDLRAEDLMTDLLNLATHAFNFLIASAWGSVVVKQTMPILLRAKASRAPAEEHNGICTM